MAIVFRLGRHRLVVDVVEDGAVGSAICGTRRNWRLILNWRRRSLILNGLLRANISDEDLLHGGQNNSHSAYAAFPILALLVESAWNTVVIWIKSRSKISTSTYSASDGEVLRAKTYSFRVSWVSRSSRGLDLWSFNILLDLWC